MYIYIFHNSVHQWYSFEFGYTSVCIYIFHNSVHQWYSFEFGYTSVCIYIFHNSGEYIVSIHHSVIGGIISWIIYLEIIMIILINLCI